MVCYSCIAVWSCVLVSLAFLIKRWIRADGDLTLLWAEWRGKKPEKELPGQVVWVTGASSGIGEELVYQLAKIGSLLVLSARRENELERVKKKCLGGEDLMLCHLAIPNIFNKIQSIPGGWERLSQYADCRNLPQCAHETYNVLRGTRDVAEISSLGDKDILIVPLDLTKRSSHGPATQTVLQHFGRIDVLVNNGGRSQRSLFVDTSIDVYNAIMELNYLGTVSLTKHVLDHMTQRKKGKIVTISSVMGIMGAPLATGYCASKHALQGFFNSLRPELYQYPGISIINICPGPVQSQIIENVFTEEISKVNASVGDQSHKMSTARCAQLTLISLVNDVKEAWISDNPYLAVCYLWQYAPTWAWWLLDIFGKKRIENFKSGVDADVSYFKKSS